MPAEQQCTVEEPATPSRASDATANMLKLQMAANNKKQQHKNNYLAWKIFYSSACFAHRMNEEMI